MEMSVDDKTMDKKAEISWADFEKVDMRVGTVVNAEAFPEARRPAIKVWIDFGEAIGELKTSAQITDLYQPENLIGRQVAAVVNFPKKQIGPFMSECLILGCRRRRRRYSLNAARARHA